VRRSKHLNIGADKGVKAAAGLSNVPEVTREVEKNYRAQRHHQHSDIINMGRRWRGWTPTRRGAWVYAQLNEDSWDSGMPSHIDQAPRLSMATCRGKCHDQAKFGSGAAILLHRQRRRGGARVRRRSLRPHPLSSPPNRGAAAARRADKIGGSHYRHTAFFF
jgi:hypothetical protein